MCVSPIYIPTRSRIISAVFNEKMYQQVPCNNCEECNTLKQREWQFRFHYEAQRSKYIYYDTLTYSDEFLPHVSDFFDTDIVQSCFNRDHLKLFLKRLRRRLDHHFNINENAFKYFIACEYGTDQRYTHRPHYHIVLFVNFDIDPLVLSRYVFESWGYGRTDGLPFKPSKYVLDHNFLVSSPSNTIKLCNYVAKYITKSSVYSRQIEPIIDSLKSSIDRNSFLTYSSYKSVLRKIPHLLRQFHVQSHHFGDNFLDSCDSLSLAYNPSVRLDMNNFVLEMSLPLYYVRRLFYNKVRCLSRYDFYEPNELGLIYLENRFVRKIHSLREKYENMSRLCRIPCDIDSLVDYVISYRASNRKPHLFLSNSEKLRYPYYINYYTDSDIDLLGEPQICSSSSGVSYPQLQFLNSHSFYGPLEPLLNSLVSSYKRLVPESCKTQFVTEHRNRLRHYYDTML